MSRTGSLGQVSASRWTLEHVGSNMTDASHDRSLLTTEGHTLVLADAISPVSALEQPGGVRPQVTTKRRGRCVVSVRTHACALDAKRIEVERLARSEESGTAGAGSERRGDESLQRFQHARPQPTAYSLQPTGHRPPVHQSTSPPSTIDSRTVCQCPKNRRRNAATPSTHSGKCAGLGGWTLQGKPMSGGCAKTMMESWMVRGRLRSVCPALDGVSESREVCVCWKHDQCLASASAQGVRSPGPNQGFEVVGTLLAGGKRWCCICIPERREDALAPLGRWSTAAAPESRACFSAWLLLAPAGRGTLLKAPASLVFLRPSPFALRSPLSIFPSPLHLLFLDRLPLSGLACSFCRPQPPPVSYALRPAPFGARLGLLSLSPLGSAAVRLSPANPPSYA